MRVHVLSDLHREFGSTAFPDVAADVVVLAGDTDRGTRGVTWARQRFRGVPVLYIAGNHEHYGERIGRLHEKLREAAAGSNVVILENETVELHGYRFFGATLWTDFNLLGDRAAAMAAAGEPGGGMNDYRRIRRSDTGPLKPHDTARLHAQSRLALTQFLQGGDRARSVVITHHAPTMSSVPDYLRAELLTAAYASNLDDLMLAHGPALWIHGHLHAARDYPLGQTRVVNNAFGYLLPFGQEETGFRGDLVIELA